MEESPCYVLMQRGVGGRARKNLEKFFMKNIVRLSLQYSGLIHRMKDLSISLLRLLSDVCPVMLYMVQTQQPGDFFEF